MECAHDESLGLVEVESEMGLQLVFMVKVVEDLLFMIIRRLPNSEYYERIGVGFLKHKTYRAAVAAGEGNLFLQVPVEVGSVRYFVY